MVPLVEQVVVLGDGDLLQVGFVGQGGGELLVDLGQDARQVPGQDIRRPCPPSTGGLGAVAVRCMKRQRFCWKYCQYQWARMAVITGCISLGALAISACKRSDLLLGLVPLDIAFQGDFLADGLDGFRDKPCP